MTPASDEKWRIFNCFFSRVGLRTYHQIFSVHGKYKGFFFSSKYVCIFCSIPSNTDESRLSNFSLKRDRLHVPWLSKLKIWRPFYRLHVLQRLITLFYHCSFSSTLSTLCSTSAPLICALKIDKKIYKRHGDFVIRLRCAIEIPELSFRSPQIYPSASHITSSVHVRWRDADASAGLVKGEQLSAAQLQGTTSHEFRQI